jgi:hypothetical protein
MICPAAVTCTLQCAVILLAVAAAAAISGSCPYSQNTHAVRP